MLYLSDIHPRSTELQGSGNISPGIMVIELELKLYARYNHEKEQNYLPSPRMRSLVLSSLTDGSRSTSFAGTSQVVYGHNNASVESLKLSNSVA